MAIAVSLVRLAVRSHLQRKILLQSTVLILSLLSMLPIKTYFFT